MADETQDRRSVRVRTRNSKQDGWCLLLPASDNGHEADVGER